MFLGKDYFQKNSMSLTSSFSSHINQSQFFLFFILKPVFISLIDAQKFFFVLNQNRKQKKTMSITQFIGMPSSFRQKFLIMIKHYGGIKFKSEVFLELFRMIGMQNSWFDFRLVEKSMSREFLKNFETFICFRTHF